MVPDWGLMMKIIDQIFVTPEKPIVKNCLKNILVKFDKFLI